MANKKITELTALTDPDANDLLAIVDDPSGSPVTKRITATKLVKSLNNQSATFVVAASDSLHKERADYVCLGVDDQVQIQAAIDALPANGGKISFAEGIYKITGNAVTPSITLVSTLQLDLGKSTFRFESPTPDGSVMISATDKNNIQIVDGYLHGNVWAGDQIDGYRILVQLTNCYNVTVDTKMAHLAVSGGTSVATKNGAYVKQIGKCYSNNIINRTHVNTVTLQDIPSSVNPQDLISNCDSGWTFTGSCDYSTDVCLSGGKSTKLVVGGLATFVLPSVIDFRKKFLHMLIYIGSRPTGDVGVNVKFLNGVNYGKDEMRIDIEGLIERWIHVVFHPYKPSSYWHTSGSFDETIVDTLTLYMLGAGSPNVYVDRIWYSYANGPCVTFSFDDEYTEVSGYLDILNAKGLRGVLAINPASIGTAGHHDWDEVEVQAQLGHEVVNHTYSHSALSYDTAACCEDQALGGQDGLISHGYDNGARFLVLPYTGKISTEGYDALRNKNILVSTYPKLNPIPYQGTYWYRGVMNTGTTLSSYIPLIDNLLKRGGHLDLYTHKPGMGISYADFEDVVNYIISKNIPVVTYSEIYDNLCRIPIAFKPMRDFYMNVLAINPIHVRTNEDLSEAIPNTFTITAQPDVPRTLSGHFDSHAQITAYTIVITGTDAKGKTVTETFTEAASPWDFETANAYATITSIIMTARTGTGAADTMDIGITDVLGLSNIIYDTGDVFKIKKNNANVAVAAAQIDIDYDTYDMSVIGLAATDDFAIWYKSNLNIIS